jgi:putative flippase GtrA
MKQLMHFAFAGTIGYIVDACMLLLVLPWTGPYIGRVVSFACAVFTTWVINRSLIFRHQNSNKPTRQEFSLYFLTTLGGAAVNFTGYFLIVYYIGPSANTLPLAVAAGSLAGMMVNFWLSKRFVFTSARKKSKCQ